MVVEVADHPFILACEFEVGLPEAVAVQALESMRPPDPSGLGDGVVQSGFYWVQSIYSERNQIVEYRIQVSSIEHAESRLM